MDEEYKKQVDLLLDIMPYVAKESCFALKGGTAINLFYWDMPRLSVDIDLTLIQPGTRDRDIKAIEAGLERIKQTLQDKLRLKVKKLDIFKLLVHKSDSKPVKIEPSINLRGTVFPVEKRDLQQSVEVTFNKTLLDIPILSFADLYGGKMVAALDRQHPRDLFDIQMLFKQGGITERITKAFIVYLLSSNRPIHEILNPNKQDISDVYKEHFEGMTKERVGLKTLLNVRERLISTTIKSLTQEQKEFIYSIKALEPKWDLFDYPECQNMPGIQWKLRNIQRLKEKDLGKYNTQRKKLADLLGVD